MPIYSVYLTDDNVKKFIENYKKYGYRSKSHLVEEAVKQLRLKHEGMDF